MNSFEYTRAEDAASAWHACDTAGAKFLAGGTNLLDLLKYRVEQPTRLVDIRKLPLNRIEARPDGTIRIGALATNSQIAWDPLIRERFPVLSEALLAGANPQLRNAATLAGNMLQRTRCWYFYDTALACNKRSPGSGCGAMMGYHRNHAVLGAGERCIAVHPSDMCVALAALDAVVNTSGPQGTRAIPFGDLHLLPGNEPHLENTLRPAELITSLDLLPLRFSHQSHYRKVRDREAFDFALASAAVALEVKAGVISGARIALGGIATKPWRSVEAERALLGAPPDEAVFLAAAEAALRDAEPRRDNAFKVELARRTIVSALEELARVSRS